MRESDIENYLIDCAHKAGGETRKIAYIGRRDATDRLVLLPGFGSFAEIKYPGEKPRPSQLREHERLRKSGFDVRVLDSFDDVDRLIQYAERITINPRR